MKPARSCVLTINSGSSSIRFAVYDSGESPRKRFGGKIDRIGLAGTTFAAEGETVGPNAAHLPAGGGHPEAAAFLLEWIEAQPVFGLVKGIGHRVVHGMKHADPVQVTPRLLAELKRIMPYDPDHLPLEIELIKAFRRRHPSLPQVACFDTAFHRNMPRVAKRLPIPRRYAAKGVERYGFHGLSYTFLMEEIGRLDPKAAKGRLILAHLGNGSSLAAVHRGKSIDTSMGFTPSSGLVMSARTGDIDPGLAYFLARTERMSPAQFQNMVNRESGLLGVSEVSSDVRDLLALERSDERAAEAVELFCYQVRKWIGSFAAALGGLDMIVFAGGIGENASVIRKRICDGLGFLGVELDPLSNSRNRPLISRRTGAVKVRVIRTDEEIMIARSVSRLLRFR